MNARREAFGQRAVLQTPIGAAIAAAAIGCQAFGATSGGAAPTEVADASGCIGTCVPDPGWQITPDCNAATAGIDRFSILDFELGQATNMYTYWDGTTFRPSFVTSSGTLSTIGYQPPTQVLPPGNDLCFPKNSVLHIVGGDFRAITSGPLKGTVVGGPFRGWGGGIGIPLQKFNGRVLPNPATTAKCRAAPTGAVTCPEGYRSDLGANGTDARCLPDPCPQSEEFAVNVGALDLGQYDGVSFWARRGPNSQKGVRVLLGDKYTDDDLNFYAYRQNFQHPDQPAQPIYCQRSRECACRNQKPCIFGPKQDQATAVLAEAFARIPGPDPGWYCRPDKLEDLLYAATVDLDALDAISDAAAVDPNMTVATDLSGGGSVVYCNQTACDRPPPAFPNELADGGMSTDPMAMGGQDPQFFGRACTPYAWPNGIATSYCFDPATDPAPAPSIETCGDQWTKVVDLSTEWQFYKVPFSDMRQQGWAKKSQRLDVHSVSVVRFTWDIGTIDYWIDDVSFYRAK
jgi:hypothetical protein